jgi:ring-1,2-phenylacetyl-CoA epoxidase subunit PaaC
MTADIAEYALRLGDDALVTAQRLAEWTAQAPELETDVALTNIALDQLGVARLLLTYAGELTGGDEDSLAYLRDDHQYRNVLLAELPNAGPAATRDAPPDFAVTVARLLYVSVYQLLTYEGLAERGRDDRLRGVAAKARKESAYHVDWAALWTVRLGDGTAGSHRRMAAAVDDLWPYTHELFDDDDLTRRLADLGVAPAPATLRAGWLDRVGPVLDRATLARPADGWAPRGGRAGRHTEHLSYLLAEMQVVHRAHPGARW